MTLRLSQSIWHIPFPYYIANLTLICKSFRQSLKEYSEIVMYSILLSEIRFMTLRFSQSIWHIPFSHYIANVTFICKCFRQSLKEYSEIVIYSILLSEIRFMTLRFSQSIWHIPFFTLHRQNIFITITSSIFITCRTLLPRVYPLSDWMATRASS